MNCEIHYIKYKFVCNDCKKEICELCINDHERHLLSLINEMKIDELLKDRENEKDFLEYQLKKIENSYKEAILNSEECTKSLRNNFRKIHNILQIQEYDLIKQIETINEENDYYYTILKSSMENKIRVLESINDQIINNYRNYNIFNNESIIKTNILKYELNQCDLDLPPFKDKIQFKHVDISYQNNNSEEDFYENIRTIKPIDILIYSKYCFSDYKETDFKDNDNYLKYIIEILNNKKENNLEIIKNISNNSNTFICSNNETILKANKLIKSNDVIILHDIKEPLNEGVVPIVDQLVINKCQNALSKQDIPNGVKSVFFINSKRPLNDIYLPPSVNTIFTNFIDIISNEKTKNKNILFKLNANLKPTTTAKSLLLGDGFNFKLSKGIIPNTIESLEIFDIQFPLEIGSIPSSVKRLNIHNGFKHKLSKGIIPDSVESLMIYNIEQPLEIGSLPLSIKYLHIHDGFKHQLSKNIIPNSVLSLSLYNIKEPLEIGSIPSSVKSLEFQDRYGYKLTKDIIPNGVECLAFHNILLNLNKDSIPSSVNEIHIFKSFFYLSKDIFPNNVNKLILHNYRYKLDTESLPLSIKHLFILEGYKYKLSKGIIPEGVEYLELSNLDEPLEEGSIPSSIKIINISDKYKYHLKKSIIPDGVINVILNEIEQPLEIGSIPSSVKNITLLERFYLKITQDIIPSSVIRIEILTTLVELQDISLPKSVEMLCIKNENIKINNEIITNHFQNVKLLYIKKTHFKTINLNLVPKSIKICSID